MIPAFWRIERRLPCSCFQPPPHPPPLRRRKPSRVPLLSKFRTISPRTPGRLRPCTKPLPALRSRFPSCRFRRCTNSRGSRFSNFWRALGIRTQPMPMGRRNEPTRILMCWPTPREQGPQSRFQLVLGGSGRAAIVTAYVPKSQIESGRASRASIETILSSASVLPAAAAKP